MAQTILIVDDDPVQRRLLQEATKRLGYEVTAVEDGESALDRLSDQAASPVSLMILDLVMPGLDGMGVLERLRQTGLIVPTIVQTAHGGIDVVVSAMRAGAVDFIVKPVSPERLDISIKNALKVNALESELTRIKRSASGTLTFKDLITKSPRMERVIRLGERAAKSNIPILIEGESGVGKEVIARAIQGSSERRSKGFVTVNCGAIPENLVESTLFGHEKGAFTGAIDKHIGKFQEAHKGTLFLDEVGELPLSVQVKLLRALQEGEIDPVGAKRSQRVDLRLISATNRTLLDLVKDGDFREDLFYRLNVFPIYVPPLRERREEIADLALHFLARFAAEEGRRHLTAIAPSALALLENYDWPGNVRQLENAIFRAVVLCDGNELTVDDMPQIAMQVDGASVKPRTLDTAEDALQQQQTPGVAHQPSHQPVEHRPAYGVIPFLDETGEARQLADMEAEMIRHVLDHYDNRMSEVARRLGIGRSTLYRKLKEFGLDNEDTAGEVATR
ncbi:sigma-54-dependent transcriptional regulator [Coralliovum pocilloporae]|uniref:sigma-54-dependent transcriptional regulator n=1 Tax=Coralliovum pocilloporae TaxID=3066369 RepID=UPI003307B1DA